MKTVFVVIEIGEGLILGIFKKEETAKSYIEFAEKSGMDKGHFRIQEHTVI